MSSRSYAYLPLEQNDERVRCTFREHRVTKKVMELFSRMHNHCQKAYISNNKTLSEYNGVRTPHIYVNV